MKKLLLLVFAIWVARAADDPALTTYTRGLVRVTNADHAVRFLKLTNVYGAVLIGNNAGAPAWTNRLRLDSLYVTNNASIDGVARATWLYGLQTNVATPALTVEGRLGGGASASAWIMSYARTTDATPTTLWSLGEADVGEHGMVGVTVDISAFDWTNGLGAFYTLHGGFAISSGVMHQVGVPVIAFQVEDVPAWDCTMDVVGGTNAVVTVTGAAGTTVYWRATSKFTY